MTPMSPDRGDRLYAPSRVKGIADKIATLPELLEDAIAIRELREYVLSATRPDEKSAVDTLRFLQARLARSPQLADLKAPFDSEDSRSRHQSWLGLGQLVVGASLGVGGLFYFNNVFRFDAADPATAVPTVVLAVLILGAIRFSTCGLLRIYRSGLRLWMTGPKWPVVVQKAALIAAARHAESAEARPMSGESDTSAGVADVRQALQDLLVEWGAYKLDIEAWYITKPLLHDTTGTVAATAAYETAMSDLVEAVDGLHNAALQAEINDAVLLADAAWSAWHEANEYAATAGLGDRTPTERAALQRLGKLVARITHSAADDPELSMIKRDIQSCLDKITTVSVGWADIAALPAVERAGTLPQLTPPNAHTVRSREPSLPPPELHQR